ncbi:MAG: hypothetical protein EON51_19370, partial [Acinetobacter sp.]
MLRRHFLQLSSTAIAATLFNKLSYIDTNGYSLVNIPDEVWAQLNNQWVKLAVNNGSSFSYQDIQVEFKNKNGGQGVFIQSPILELGGVRLKWNYKTSASSKILGDHWERSYGDLAWKSPEPAAKNPWYVLLNDSKQTACFGVKTGANTICWWNVNPNTIDLTLDCHSGGVGVKMGQRRLFAATIVTMLGKAEENTYQTTTRFCKLMCDRPMLPKQPVYGINDWYVA